MTTHVSQENWSLLNRSEEEVLQALQGLPPTYQVSFGERLQLPPNETGGIGRTYLPDFVIEMDGGQQVVVEVKSPQSLTMVNLSRFLAIDKQLREAGKKFLLLVPDTQTGQKTMNETENFDDLHIYSFSNEAEIIDAVIKEFDTASPAKL